MGHEKSLCVLRLLCMSPQTSACVSMCVIILLYVLRLLYICPDTIISVLNYICALILLAYMCPHTTVCVFMRAKRPTNAYV